MKTVLIIYEKWVDAPHALLEDYKVTFSEIVEVENLTDLNEKFKNIKKIDVLEEKYIPKDNWTIIKKLTDMPSKKIDCWFIHQGKIIKGYFDDRWFNSNHGVYGWKTISHFQEIKEPDYPLT